MRTPDGIRAFIGLGSNLNDPVERVRESVRALGQFPGTQLLAGSTLYRNPPLGPGPQPDFINAVAEISTRLGPLELLDALQCEETRQGRRRDAVRWAPRTIDLDLLIYGETSIHDERLTVPHPELARRPFAIYPLHELAPDLHIPGLGALAALWRGMPDASMTPVGRAMIPVVGEAGVDCANG